MDTGIDVCVVLVYHWQHLLATGFPCTLESPSFHVRIRSVYLMNIQQSQVAGLLLFSVYVVRSAWRACHVVILTPMSSNSHVAK